MKKYLIALCAIVLSMGAMAQNKVAYVEWLNETSGEEQKAKDYFDQFFVNTSFSTCDVSIGKFINTRDIVNNTDSKMGDVKVLWLNIDRPANSYETNQEFYNLESVDFVTYVKNFVQNGGSLLLTKDAVKMVHLIGRMCEPSVTTRGVPNADGFNGDGFTNNAAKWVVNATIGSDVFGRTAHPVYSGLTTDTDGRASNTGIRLLNTDSWRTEIRCYWGDLYPQGEGLTPAATKKENNDLDLIREFEQSWNCVILGRPGNITDYWGASVVEFLPGLFNGEEWKGTIIAVGDESLQWTNENSERYNKDDAANTASRNVPVFLKNTINYLLTKPNAAASTTFSTNAAIGSGKYVSTLYAEQATLIPTGVTAFKATVDGENMHLNKISGNIIPANTGVMLVSETTGSALDFQLYPVTAESIGDNAFSGTTTATTGSALKSSTYSGKTLYVLSKKDDVVGFYQLGDATTVGAGKAFLVVDGTSPARSFGISIDDDGEVTAIAHVTADASATRPNAIYNLNGQRLSSVQRGVNIVNGKKVVVK